MNKEWEIGTLQMGWNREKGDGERKAVAIERKRASGREWKSKKKRDIKREREIEISKNLSNK